MCSDCHDGNFLDRLLDSSQQHVIIKKLRCKIQFLVRVQLRYDKDVVIAGLSPRTLSSSTYANNLSTLIDPEEAPNITVVEKGRHFCRLRIQPISNVFWNGRPVGYRIYYQSLLKLNSPVNLTDMNQIRQTHQHMNFTNFNQSVVAVDGLEVFTNYSLIVCAYNSYGEGPVTQIFERTHEGGRLCCIIIIDYH